MLDSPDHAKHISPSPKSHADIVALLERHDREWKKAYQLVEERKDLLCATENELLETCNQIEITFPTFQQVEQDLQSAMLEPDALELPAQLVSLFEMSKGMAQHLETLGSDLAATVARRSSAWEQYADSIKEARRVLRELTS